MRVLAVDPGYDRLGVAVFEGTGHDPILMYSACVTTNKKSAIPDRLHEIGKALTSVIKKYKPTCVAIETLFFNKNQKTAIAVAETRGVISYIARLHGIEVREYSPQAVKIAVTGYGKSSKEQVEGMVKRLVPHMPKKALDDEYDAAALAITCLASRLRT